MSEEEEEEERLARYRRILAEEATELAEEMEGAFNVLRRGEAAAAPEAYGRLLRALHTLKGSAQVMGEAALGDWAHELEERVGRARDGEGEADFSVALEPLYSWLEAGPGSGPTGAVYLRRSSGT